jgi:hypothetical protein
MLPGQHKVYFLFERGYHFMHAMLSTDNWIEFSITSSLFVFSGYVRPFACDTLFLGTKGLRAIHAGSGKYPIGRYNQVGIGCQHRQEGTGE